MKRDNKIKAEGKEGDTYFIYLNDGWQNGSGEHSIAEDSKRIARARLRDCRPCYCSECREVEAEAVLAEPTDYEYRCCFCGGGLIPSGQLFWMTPSGNYCSKECAKGAEIEIKMNFRRN